MSAEPARPALLAEDIRAGYGAGDIIHGVSVQVAPGAVVSVVGPNGSGKSTLLKALCGVIRPSAGQVRVGDRDITGLPPEEVARAGVGYVPQVDDVFAPLTVRENLEMGGYLLAGRAVAERVDRVVGVFPRLGNMLTRRAGRLSGGERKMLAMGRVLMLEPAVFLLDEPTANLAPRVATELLTSHVRALARSRRRSAHRRAAGPGRAGHLRLHLRAGRRSGTDGGHPGAPERQPGVHRVLLRRGPESSADSPVFLGGTSYTAVRSGRRRPPKPAAASAAPAPISSSHGAGLAGG